MAYREKPSTGLHRAGAVAALALATSFGGAALGAPAAGAETPFVLDANPGTENPHVAVDERGTSHVVWNESVVDGDDVAHYCKVPRGGRSCSRRQELPVPGLGVGLFALAPDGDTVIVIHGGCCDNDHFVYAWVSEDGGETFGARSTITGTRTWGWNTGGVTGAGPVLGPGPFAVSIFAPNAFTGLEFQAAPLDGPPEPQRANLGAEPAAYGVGFVDGQTPIVAFGDNVGGPVYFRRFAGGADYNNSASWGPRTLVTQGDDARIASLPGGRRGVHLLVRENGQRFVHRRFDGQTFADPVQVSPPEDTGRLQDFFLDPSGRVHALWTDPGSGNVRHRTSADGVRWGSAETLIANYFGGAYSFRAAAACDGGGLGTFHKDGRIQALPFGRTEAVDCEAGADPSCIQDVRVGRLTQVEAQAGCFRRQGSTYRIRGDVRVNGIDLAVGGGVSSRRAAGAAPATVAIDRKARTLRTGGPVVARIGSVVLGREKLGWKLPKGKDVIKDLAGNPATFDTAKAGSELFGLPVGGYVVPEIVGRGQGGLTSNLALPAPFTASTLGGKASASSVLRFDNLNGLNLGGQKIAIDDASIGIAGLAPFKLSFDAGTSTLRGEGALKLPVTGHGLKTSFQLKGGAFDFGRAELDLGSPGIPVAPKVFLRRIDFAIEAGRGCERPTKIAAGGRIVAVPAVAADLALLDIDPLSASYSLPNGSCGIPGVFELTGSGKVVGVRAAQVRATYRTDGQFTFAAGLGIEQDLALCSAKAGIDAEGGVNLTSGNFYAMAGAQANLCDFDLVNARAIVSSIGIASCAKVALVEGGFEYRWGQGLRVDLPPSCGIDLGSFKPAEFTARATGSNRARAASFTVPPGLRSVLVRIDGTDGAPGFELSGPGGLRISHPGGDSDPVSAKQHAIFPAPSAMQTNVRVNDPRPGSYTVADHVQGPAIEAVNYARSLPKPRVRAKVRSGRGKRTLSFRARKITGQSLLFVEEGRGGVRSVIGRARKARGKIRFRPAPGRGGRRRVLAIVEQRGTPRATLPVARYKAPKAQRPGKPRKLRLKRKSRAEKLIVRWRRAPRARRYVVAWKLRDGRRGSKTVKKPRAVIAGVPGINGGKVRVAGLRADNIAGKPATSKLRPKPKQRRKPRR